MSLSIYAAVDILNGKCVQLKGGKLGTQKFYGSPLKAAQHWQEEGADFLHIIDLNASLGKGDNCGLVKEIINKIQTPVQVGGGIRNSKRMANLLKEGADRIIVGTRGIEDRKWLIDMANRYPGRIVLAIDAHDYDIVTRGWKRDTNLNILEVAKEVDHIGLDSFLYTNVEVEGREGGIKTKPIKDLTDRLHTPVIASGGISSLEDIRTINELKAGGIVIGSALYSGKLRIPIIKNFL